MRRVSTSHERAKTALHIIIFANVLIFAYRDSLRPQLHLRRTYRIQDGNLYSMLLSIFYHIEPTHLFMNMVGLYRYGTEIFVHSSSKRWASVLIIISSYIICGLGAFLGVELLSRYHEYQWEQKVNQARNSSRCTHWLCKSLNDALGEDISSVFTNAFADLSMSFKFADIKVSLWYYQAMYRIGASGVIYGWMGMRVLTSWMSQYHSKLDGLDYFFVVATLAQNLNESPISLDDLKISYLVEGEGVDHAAHLTGFVSGMLWALVLILLDRANSAFGLFGGRWILGRNRSAGRRLGASWEDEQVIREQQRQRVQNSRLLNPQSSGGQRSRERL